MRGSCLPLPFGLERAYLVLQDMPRPSETLLPWPRAAQCSPCAAAEPAPRDLQFQAGPPVASAPLKLLHSEKKEAPHPHPKRLGSKTSLEASALSVQMLRVEKACDRMGAAHSGRPRAKPPAHTGQILRCHCAPPSAPRGCSE